MASTDQSIAAFPAWALLNGIDINGLRLDYIPDKGFGFVTDKELSAPADDTELSRSPLTVIHIPRDLILSSEAVDEYAKVDQNFRQLMEVAGQHVRRQSLPSQGSH